VRIKYFSLYPRGYVGRHKDTEVELRNRMIVLKLREGKPIGDLCAETGLSTSRIYQIIKETAPLMPDDNMRAWQALKYERMAQRAWEVALSPGRPMFNGKGEHCIDGNTGEYAYDVSTVTQSLDILNRIEGNISRLFGTEKPPMKPVEVMPGLSEFANRFKEREHENTVLKEQLAQLQSRLAAIEGSVPADVVEE
jgi:hypothetical protein